MLLAEVKGHVVSTTKDMNLQGKKLLIVKPLQLEPSDRHKSIVAVDTVGAGQGEIVLIATGSSARSAECLDRKSVVDASIVAIVDTWAYKGNE